MGNKYLFMSRGTIFLKGNASLRMFTPFRMLNIVPLRNIFAHPNHNVRYNRFMVTIFKKILVLVWLCLVGIYLLSGQMVSAQTNGSQIIVMTADGPITPAMAQYLSRGIRIAERQGAEALIFQLNTPGGSIDTMTEMEQMILASTVPVVVYVSPPGAMAALPGTIIKLASHASAMAPNTPIGAASAGGRQGEN